MKRFRTIVTYLAAYFFTISTILRIQSGFRGDTFQTPITIPLVIFVILFVIEPLLSRRSHIFTNIYLLFQTAIISFLLFAPPHVDYFSVFFFVLTLQAMHVFPERIGIRWVIAFILIMASSMIYGFGLSEGLGLLINYTIAYLMVAGLVTITKRAERAREKSQSLLGELQVAHQQLQDYADQIEELTVEQERSRLARNLHDSVTQTIFSMTLTAEAAKILMERDQKQTAEQLDKLLELARSALAEMRSLIFELRPTTIAEEGLIPALRQYLSTLEEHNNLKVDLQINGDPELSTKLAQRLFYIIREALNNIVKHANVDTATIDLEFSNEEISLRVEDQGIGFDSDSMDPTKKTMGLSSMRERVERCGGTLTIDSRPGIGTRVLVEVPTSKESGHDN